MTNIKKKILIVDELGFSRICSAILEQEGYGTKAICDVRQLDSAFNSNDVGLVITSYPCGEHLLEKLKSTKIPAIILSDYMNRELMVMLDYLGTTLSHCMIKPVDYHEFKALVSQKMNRGEDVVTQ
jgi:DNA-binding NtrC family response regulator